MDFARARQIMVDSQVRTADVTDVRIIAAMRDLPRERFTPAQSRSVAYGDMEVEVAPGRTLMRPRYVAKLIQALDRATTTARLAFGTRGQVRRPRRIAIMGSTEGGMGSSVVSRASPPVCAWI